jgi:AcrR family transcriptional regulator
MAQHDRRVRRTRRLLIEALIALIMEKGYAKITVQDILDRADIGRSTFYAHFRDREALLVACFDNVRDELRREIGALTPGESPPDPALPAAAIFAHAQRRRPVYRALCGRQGGTIVIEHLHGLVRGLLEDHLRPHLAAAGADMPVEVAAEFHASATVGLLSWWVECDFPYEPSRLTELYRRLATPGMLAVLDPEVSETGSRAGASAPARDGEVA